MPFDKVSLDREATEVIDGESHLSIAWVVSSSPCLWSLPMVYDSLELNYSNEIFFPRDVDWFDD